MGQMEGQAILDGGPMPMGWSCGDWTGGGLGCGSPVRGGAGRFFAVGSVTWKVTTWIFTVPCLPFTFCRAGVPGGWNTGVRAWARHTARSTATTCHHGGAGRRWDLPSSFTGKVGDGTGRRKGCHGR